MQVSTDDDSHEAIVDTNKRPWSDTKKSPIDNKRLKLEETDAGNNSSATEKETTTNLVQDATTRLSKWAARLFDPNRIKGIMQSPQTIPLNDEFLKAFGKREKEHDVACGKEFEIDNNLEDNDNDEEIERIDPPPSTSSKHPVQVKIANLKYTTTYATLEAACEAFGPLEELKLIMNNTADNNSTENKGVAYVAFGNEQAAQACIDNFKTLEGRPLNVAFVATHSTTPKASASRYWLNDNNESISFKCYRCGEAGHRESDCTQPVKAKPCPMCAQLTHDLRACPYKAVCFNCGVPGHISNRCPRPRGIPPRRLEATIQHAAKAVCVSCHQPGHFLCREFKWFVGLEHGMTCFNCGRFNHNGFDCDRVRPEECMHREDLVATEIERVNPEECTEELIRLERRRDEDMRRREEVRRRAKSAPPRRDRWR